MVKIIPFCGYRFNPEKIENFGEVMAPPYDKILLSEQEELYKRNEYNIVRLNKGIQKETDDELNNSFTRARKYLDEWIEKNVLIKEDKKAFYLYEQEVTYKNTSYKNLGLVGLLELSDLDAGDVFQCERPNENSKPSRKKLLEQTLANFSMINCIYIEYEKALMNKLTEITEKFKPDMEFKTHETIVGEDVRQRVWAIKDTETVEFIREILSAHTLYIADGQTRYEVSLEYKKEMEKKNKNHTGDEPYNYIMALFTNAFDDGLIQLPVHRLVKSKKNFSEDFFIACAQDYFKVEKIIIDTTEGEFVDIMKKQIAVSRKKNQFAVYCGGDYFYRFTLKDYEHIKMLLPDASDAYCSLDVTILDNIILKELLNISDDQMPECVSYTTRSSHGYEAVKSGEIDCMIVLNPVSALDICNVATSHDRMPERSMFIFPKASTGVVVYNMEEETI